MARQKGDEADFAKCRKCAQKRDGTLIVDACEGGRRGVLREGNPCWVAAGWVGWCLCLVGLLVGCYPPHLLSLPLACACVKPRNPSFFSPFPSESKCHFSVEAKFWQPAFTYTFVCDVCVRGVGVCVCVHISVIFLR